MKKYSALLFDADDTLLDFQKDEAQALSMLLKNYGIKETAQNISTYKQINLSLWKALERDEIDKETLKKVRFSLFFEKIGCDIPEDPMTINERYLSYLALGGNLMPGAKRLVQQCFDEGYEMYIITNGIEKTQKKRLAEAGILPFFREIFVSETIGFQKPRAEYFNFVLANIEEKDKSRVLVIGDSLTSDIKGAVYAGIPCAWLRPSPAASCGQLTPDYIIDSIEEIKSFI